MNQQAFPAVVSLQGGNRMELPVSDRLFRHAFSTPQSAREPLTPQLQDKHDVLIRLLDRTFGISDAERELIRAVEYPRGWMRRAFQVFPRACGPGSRALLQLLASAASR
ncbi:MAG: hypothetical protein EA404_00085 [Spirochaetaceae bacterium]|nr:MAG: hypothetical protein EA404_00085 [Spirochaetaceae bacterium]